MINILDFSLEDVANAIVHAFRWLFAILSALIYDLIVKVYDLFTYLSTIDFFNNEGLLGEIYRRIGMILGLFMVFKLIFTLIQSLVDPNKLNDKKNGFVSIIIRSVIAIVLLGIVPFIYKEAMSLQTLLVGDNNILYKLIIGKDVPSSDNFGKEVAAELYFSFYRDDEEPFLSNACNTADPNGICREKKIDEIKDKILVGEEMANNVKKTYTFSYPNQYLNLQTYVVNGEKTYVIEYNEILSVAIGGVFLWMLLMYCVQISIRIFQLAYLRLIAPIPILSYINDPSGVFQKWLKQCSTTYLDLFIRLAIIYFVIFFSNYLIDFFDELGDNVINIFAEVFLLIGLFMFAQKVPKLLSEILPTSGGSAGFDFGLKAPKPLANVTRFGAGMALGALGGGAANLIHGGINSYKTFREEGAKEGFKAIGKTALSTVGGIGGGAVQGSKIKKFSFDNVGNAVKVSNQNREKRELKAKAGYHLYNPIPTVQDKILSFAGDTTGAEAKIKEAQRQQQMLELSKATLWKSIEDDVKNGDLKYSSYQLLRGLHKGEIQGNKVWLVGDGKLYANDELELNAKIASDIRIQNPGIDVDSKNYGHYVTETAETDKKIKDQGKIIKGLETANRDAKK